MRIAFISYEYPPDSSAGGIATYVEQAARMQTGRGHDVEVFASSPHRDTTVEIDGIRVHWIRETDRLDFGIVAGHRFTQRHAECPFDVLEGPEYNADARKAVQLVPDMPLVVKMHTPSRMIAEMNAAGGLTGSVENTLRRTKNWLGACWRSRMLAPVAVTQTQIAYSLYNMEREHARQADVVAPPCEDLCRYAQKVWGVAPERIKLTPHPYTPRKEFLTLNPKNDGYTVGFVGRLEKRKGIETLVRAIPLVLREQPKARFRLVGAPLARPGSGQRYDAWIHDVLGSAMGNVDMPGKTTLAEMPGVYDALDVCVFPSLWENFPNVCLEAMAAGRAVIGSAAGGMAEMLDQGKVGRLVQPGDHIGLADQIIHLLRHPEERIKLGTLARQRVLAAYNQSVIGAMMENVYLDAIEAKKNTMRTADREGVNCSHALLA